MGERKMELEREEGKERGKARRLHFGKVFRAV